MSIRYPYDGNLAIERYIPIGQGYWKTLLPGKGIRLSLTSNGVVEKLRDSRGRRK
ncbi:hypothetical protein SAMN04487936_10838 [Halobacillus dabanensis]|uniref:Uncharacterized protein n=1 Tax=Halobacillus dabanensis TaxID=240302 RepID=A0A1I3X8U2_HALDA|nr:hypothetical protein SAMN04487936_10838 [Halobacillus dabanensis]